MALPSWSFLVVGLGISLLSLRQVLAGEKMGIFIVVGIGMIIYGIVRMIRERSSSKNIDKHEPLVHGGMHARHTAGQGQENGNHMHAHATQIPRVCSSCGAKNNPRANYCGHCGNKIRG